MKYPLRCLLSCLFAIVPMPTFAGSTQKGAELPISSFNPASAGALDAIAFDPVSGNVFVHQSFGMIYQFTPTGIEVGTAFATPGSSSNDIDLDFAPIGFTLGTTVVAQDTLLVGNGETNPETLFAVATTDGSVLASGNLPDNNSQTVGVAFHASRGTLFVLDWQGDQIFEASAIDGSILNTFPVAPPGSPAFDVFFGDVDVKQTSGTLLIVSSASGGRVRELSPTGEFIRDVDLSGASDVAFSGVAVDDQTGDVWISSTSGLIMQFGPLGGEVAVDDPTTMAGDTFGSAVAIDGNLMVVGLPGADISGTDSGAVAIYRIEGGGPVLETTLAVPSGFTAEGFGASVGVSGDTIVIGTAGIGTAQKGTASAMAAAVFQRLSGGGAFTFKQPLTGNDMSTSGDGFGTAVAISENAILVGAPSDDENETPGQGSGAGYVFHRLTRNENFETPVKVKPPLPDPGARFGRAVAIRGTKAAIGAPQAKPNGGPATGSTALYDAVAGAINRLGSVTGSSSNAGARFGSSVAIDSGGTVVVGSPMESAGTASPRGAAYLFNSNSPSLGEVSRITPEDPTDDAEFGASVAIDQGTIVVGAPKAENGGLNNGAVYRFKQAGASVTQISRTSPFPGQVGLGSSVAISADRVASGAPLTESSEGSVLLLLDSGRIFGSGFE